MWPIEARCAAIANNYFTVAINRIGTVSIVWPHVFLNTLYSFFFLFWMTWATDGMQWMFEDILQDFYWMAVF